MALVTLTSDFGTRDAYVGAMKGALLDVDSELILVDLSHELPAQDVRAGMLFLRHATQTFPSGTVHLAVIDPGVGSSRRGLAIDDGTHRWVGPDNGLFSHVLCRPDIRVHELSNTALRRTTVSHTFHGRDVFAPAAAHLASGLDIHHAGPAIDDPVLLPASSCRHETGTLYGEIVHVDHFGNLISNIDCEDLDLIGGVHEIALEDLTIAGIATTYADAEVEQILALIGSSGQLEISVRNGSAAQRLSLTVGAEIAVSGSKAGHD